MAEDGRWPLGRLSQQEIKGPRRFMSNLSEVRALGFDERFVRMWEYYLALCEAGFAAGIFQDVQIGFEKRNGVRVPVPA